MGMFFTNSGRDEAHAQPGAADRKPAVAGRFYPADKTSLENTLHELFSKAKPGQIKDVLAVICPHAGYVFSGQVAASGYNQIDPEKQYNHVFLLASSHQSYFRGASVFNAGNYQTPLGKVEVDTELANRLIRDNPVFSFRSEADRTEHSTEVQVPFLQYHLKKPFKLVPIVLGTQNPGECKEIARALMPYFREGNLFVISTDFSHYPAYEDAITADKTTCEAICTKSSEALIKALDQYKAKEIPNLATNLCGWTSVLTLLYIIEGMQDVRITPVEYMNSGDSRYGDHDQVVGYWSLAVSKESSAIQLTDREKVELLSLAREAIRLFLLKGKIDESAPAAFTPAMELSLGAFVTLKNRGSLRGCIGQFSPDAPIYKTIRHNAVAAATRDSRFESVTLPEMEEIEIEISLLSPLRKISSPSEIIPGKHGIYIKKGYRSGTFLPQVATETGWSVEEFLGHCSRDKAGLGWDGWKSAELYVYEAMVFSENEFTSRKH